LLELYRFIVYPRAGVATSRFDEHPSFIRAEAPLVTISSTFIREGIRNGKDLRYFVPGKVWEYIREMHFYE
jgi:nicotinate-nucleotide adenylyltransferase